MVLLLNCDLIVSIVQLWLIFNIAHCLFNPRPFFLFSFPLIEMLTTCFHELMLGLIASRYSSLSGKAKNRIRHFQVFRPSHHHRQVHRLRHKIVSGRWLSPFSFHFLLNRFSSKLRYIFCMLIFFQVLLEINNGKIIFLRDNSCKKGASSSLVSLVFLSPDNFLRELFQVKFMHRKEVCLFVRLCVIFCRKCTRFGR